VGRAGYMSRSAVSQAIWVSAGPPCRLVWGGSRRAGDRLVEDRPGDKRAGGFMSSAAVDPWPNPARSWPITARCIWCGGVGLIDAMAVDVTANSPPVLLPAPAYPEVDHYPRPGPSHRGNPGRHRRPGAGARTVGVDESFSNSAGDRIPVPNAVWRGRGGRPGCCVGA